MMAGLFHMAVHAQDTLEPGASSCTMRQRPAPYPVLRQANVAWERRVWRVIDLRDEGNAVLRSALNGKGCPGLFQVIVHGLLDEGAITAFDPGPMGEDDAFSKPFSRAEIASVLAGWDTWGTAPVTRYMLKEDWIFDKERGVMDVRIIGLAPLKAVLGEEGELQGHAQLFWLYFPECRNLFARWAALGAGETAVSFEAVLGQRRFISTVLKVSNGMGRAIDAYATGGDAVLQSDAVREQLFHLGFDLWNY